MLRGRLLLLALCALAVAQLAVAQAEWVTGTLAELGFGSVTPSGAGACGYGDLSTATAWPFGNFASIDPDTSPFALAGNMSGCGVCLEVECTQGAAGGCSSGSAKVLVTDSCKGCGADVVYVSPPAFRNLVTDSVGQVTGRFRQAPCDPPTDIVVVVTGYRPTQGGWIRLALLGVAGSGDVTAVEIKGSPQPDTAWKPMTRTFGGTWESSVLPAPPLDLRITSGGRTLVARNVITQAGATGNFPTGVQFAAGGAAPGVPPATPGGLAASPTPAEPASAVLPSSPLALPSPSLAAVLPAPAPLPEAAVGPTPTNAIPADPFVLAPTPAPSPEPLPTASPLSALNGLSGLPSSPAPAPAPEAEPLDESAVSLLTPQTAAAVRQPLLGPLAPSPSPVITPEAAAPQAEGAEVPLNVSAGPYCASCKPCSDRLGEPVGMQPVAVSYTPRSDLPTLPAAPAAAGPASAAEVEAAAAAAAGGAVDGGAGNCSTLLEILESISEAWDWLELMKRVGLEGLLSNPRAKITLLVPAEPALNATINACPLRNETELADLLNNAPELSNPLVGYHVIRGLWPTNTLLPGTALNSSDTIDKVNFLQVQVGPDRQLVGIGSNAAILQSNIVACGPSIIHIVDTVLLPFSFTQGPVDAIKGTEVPPHTNITAQPLNTTAVTASGGPSGRRLLSVE